MNIDEAKMLAIEWVRKERDDSEIQELNIEQATEGFIEGFLVLVTYDEDSEPDYVYINQEGNARYMTESKEVIQFVVDQQGFFRNRGFVAHFKEFGGMPALLGLVVTLVFSFLCLTGRIPSLDKGDALVGLMGTVFGYFFRERYNRK